jgi:hypothetical protein
MLDRLVVSSLGIVAFFPDTLTECAGCGAAVHLALLSDSNFEAIEVEGWEWLTWVDGEWARR